jgi:hypothetical protein
MNITDFKDLDIRIPDSNEGVIAAIFDRQKALHYRYKPIELHNKLGLGLVDNWPFSLDDPRWQYIIKDFAWRVTEELTEALEAHEDGNHLHTLEEIIDALHFYTELLIICGYSSKHINCRRVDEPITDILRPIYKLGIACNFLKQKPWKNTHVITDKLRFKDNLIAGYKDLLWLAMDYGLETMAGVYVVYMQKSYVNQFRIDSNY